MKGNNKNAFSANFKDRIEKFDEYFNDLGIESYRPEKYHKIFTELGFTYVEDGCNGFCPECEQMLKYEVYPVKN